MKYTLFILLTTCAFSACNQTNPAISTIDVNGNPVHVIQYEQIQDTVQIKLSQLAEDLRFIPLETKEECLFGSAKYFVYDKYIIVIERNKRIMQFSGDGKFIRQICRYGQGPREFQGPVIAVDEEHDILFLGDGIKSYIMSWDLNTGAFIKEIPNPYKGKLKRIHYTQEGTLLIAPIVGDRESGKFYLWEQDLDGNIIRQIEAPPTKGWVDSDTDILLYTNGKGYNYLPVDADTVFRVDEERLTPSWFIDLGKKNEDLDNKPGHRSFTYGFESARFFSGRVYTLEKVDMIKYEGGVGYTTNGKHEYLTLDKKTGEIYLNQKIYNDFVAEETTLSWFGAQSNQTIHLQIMADHLVEHAEKVLEDSKADPKVKSRLKKLLDQVDIEDNPILIVGRLRK